MVPPSHGARRRGGPELQRAVIREVSQVFIDLDEGFQVTDNDLLHLFQLNELIVRPDEGEPCDMDQGNFNRFVPVFHHEADGAFARLNFPAGKRRPFEGLNVIFFGSCFQARILCGIQVCEFQLAVDLIIQLLYHVLQFFRKLRELIQAHQWSNGFQGGGKEQLDPDFLGQPQEGADLVIELLYCRCQHILQPFCGRDGGNPFNEVPVN